MTTRKRKPQILSALRRKGIRIWLESYEIRDDIKDEIKIEHEIKIEPESRLTEDDQSQFRSAEAELIEALRSENAIIQAALGELFSHEQAPSGCQRTGNLYPDPLEGPVCWLHYIMVKDPTKIQDLLPALRQGGFPKKDWEQLTHQLDELVGSYCSHLTSKSPRDSEIKDELWQVADGGKRLLTKLKNLSLRSRNAVLDAKWGFKPGTTVDPFELAPSIQELVTRAIIASVRFPEDPSGIEADKAFDDLLLNLGIVWRVYHSDEKSITKVKDDYRGPLLGFVLAVLREHPLSTFDGRSDPAISARLFKIRKRIDEDAPAIDRR